MKKINLATVEVYESTGYGWYNSKFQDFMSNCWDLFEREFQAERRRWNGTTVFEKIAYTERDDHDGEEGYFKCSITLPEEEATLFRNRIKNIYHVKDLALGERIKPKKAMKFTEGELLWAQYRNRSIGFRIDGLKHVCQKFRNGEPTEFKLKNDSKLSKKTVLKLVHHEFDDIKITRKPRKDASIESKIRIPLYGISIEALKLLAKVCKKNPSVIEFVNYENSYISIKNEAKADMIKAAIKEQEAK